MKIRLVTINTWKCDGDYFKRRQVLADQLKKLTPHIVACQECFLSQDETIDTLRFLAEELDMYYHYVHARLKFRMMGDQEILGYSGMGVLSAFRIDPVSEFDLPTCEADGERKVQQVALEINKDKKILFTNVHLTHLSNAGDLRESQLDLIVEKTSLGDYHHNIICGDFNATLGSDEIQRFISQTGAADGYAAGGGAEPRISVRDGNACIDHIFSLPVAETQSYTAFSEAAIVLNEPDTDGVFPSDHFGISTTLITV